MSKRYGRNQRRKARERIKELEELKEIYFERFQKSNVRNKKFKHEIFELEEALKFKGFISNIEFNSYRPHKPIKKELMFSFSIEKLTLGATIDKKEPFNHIFEHFSEMMKKRVCKEIDIKLKEFYRSIERI